MARNEAGLAAFQAGAPMLQVRDLRTSILKPASFSLSAGEALAVRGASGAGKTLLLRAVADLDPNEGLVTLDGRTGLVGGYCRRALWRVDSGTCLRQRAGLSGRDKGVADRTALDRGAIAA